MISDDKPKYSVIPELSDMSRGRRARIEVEIVLGQHVDVVQHQTVVLAERPRHHVADVQQRTAIKQPRRHLNSTIPDTCIKK